MLCQADRGACEHHQGDVHVDQGKDAQGGHVNMDVQRGATALFRLDARQMGPICGDIDMQSPLSGDVLQIRVQVSITAFRVPLLFGVPTPSLQDKLAFGQRGARPNEVGEVPIRRGEQLWPRHCRRSDVRMHRPRIECIVDCVSVLFVGNLAAAGLKPSTVRLDKQPTVALVVRKHVLIEKGVLPAKPISNEEDNLEGLKWQPSPHVLREIVRDHRSEPHRGTACSEDVLRLVQQLIAHQRDLSEDLEALTNRPRHPDLPAESERVLVHPRNAAPTRNEKEAAVHTPGDVDV
mmetsp:Transcript_53952/g.163922  ORF Transcript_53952/g.163922 Transcript_53952/m.163922 type:complete len:292 (-) Transcript_53952:107-982(-)